MFNSFELMKNSVKKYSSSKLVSVVIGNNYKNYLKAIISIPVVFFVLAGFISNVYAFFVIYFLYVLVIVFVFSSRKVGIGINDKMLFLEYFKLFGFAPKNIYDVPIDKIKYISVYRFGMLTYVKVSFISNDKRLVQAKIMYARTFRKQKESAIKMSELLLKIQKEKDKGDF